MSKWAKSPAFLVTAALIGFGMAALMSKSEPASGALFFVPFALGPLFVSLLLAAIAPNRSCQITLVIGSLLYSVWFGFVFLNAFYWHIDPQSSIAMIFIGIYSLPVMIPVWLLSLVLRHRHKVANGQPATRIGSKPEGKENPQTDPDGCPR